MRGILVGLATIAWISSASAQGGRAPDDGLGPYHFGMTIADAETTSQRATWRIQDIAGVGQVLTGGPTLRVGSSDFAATFVFNEQALRHIALSGQTSSLCVDSVRTLLETDLEPSFGIFTSAPNAQEAGRLTNASETPGGSEIREIDDASNAHVVFSSRRGGMFIQVKGEPRADAQGCRLSIRFSAQSPYAGALLAPISYDELDHARSLVNPRWIARPGVHAFEVYYPRAARDRPISGKGVLDCLVNSDGSLRCLVAGEIPEGEHFGEAALHIAQDFRVLQSQDGASAVGKRIQIGITFRMQ